MAANRSEWHERILAKISNSEDSLEKFYTTVYPESSFDSIGNSCRVNPCPFCGHNDCFTVTPGVIGAQCFSQSCRVSGNHINLVLKKYNNPEVLRRIGDMYKDPYVESSGTEDKGEERLQHIRNLAADFYHSRLMANTDYIRYQTDVRGHKLSSLETFRVGVSGDYLTLRKGLLEEGFTEDEVKASRVWIPDGLFVYPYIDPFTKNVTRFNTKNPFKVEWEDHKTKEKKVVQGFSTGAKTMFTTPTLSYSYVVLVEGENDLITFWEVGGQSAIAIGGTLAKDQISILQRILERFETIYCLFDNDDAGEGYVEAINNAFPHKPVFKVNYDKSFKDPDEYYKKNNSPVPIDKLLSRAEQLSTKEFKIDHKGNTWWIANRDRKLEFEILDKNKNNNLVGTVTYYEKGQLKDKAYDSDITKSKVKPMNFYLLAEIEKHFNDGIDSKTFEELVAIYWFTKYRNQTIKKIASLLHEAGPDVNSPQVQEAVDYLKIHLGEEVTDIILKELNQLQNKEVQDFAEITKMKAGQHFNIKNNDAFFYFTYVREDGDTIKKLPYIITNDAKNRLIRLDLYKRKDPQCIILIKNSYELALEVPSAIGELQENSLSQTWVKKYIDGEIDSRELRVDVAVRSLEKFIRRFYYFQDEVTYKIIALYIFGTYCYELFGEFPYLFINGKKGTGKTVLDTVLYLTCFNPKMATSISPAALFRGVAVEGGTYILDEMENITSRQEAKDSDMAAILKGGYSKSGRVIRCNPEKDNVPESFDIYGPKVISNIFGLEDIIADRCISINTFEVPEDKVAKLERIKQYANENLGTIRELTSKCCLTVLENFRTIYETFMNTSFKSGNLRLSQIMTPLATLAHLAGDEYTRALAEYYNSYITVSKEEIEHGTPEGALRNILRDIAQEIIGNLEPGYLSNHIHKYREDIKIGPGKEWFQLNSLHIKTFMEEAIPDETVDVRDVNIWVKRAAPIDLRKDRGRTTATIEDETLIHEFNGNTRVKVYVYKFYLKDLLPKVDFDKYFNPVKTEQLPQEPEVKTKKQGKFSDF